MASGTLGPFNPTGEWGVDPPDLRPRGVGESQGRGEHIQVDVTRCTRVARPPGVVVDQKSPLNNSFLLDFHSLFPTNQSVPVVLFYGVRPTEFEFE